MDLVIKAIEVLDDVLVAGVFVNRVDETQDTNLIAGCGDITGDKVQYRLRVVTNKHPRLGGLDDLDGDMAVVTGVVLDAAGSKGIMLLTLCLLQAIRC
jgi:hypothetical protein